MQNILIKVIRKIKHEGIKKAICNYVRKTKTLKKELAIIQKYHLIDEEERLRQKNYTFKCKEKISIITPLYNTPQDYLIELIESLKKQTYSNWELCLTDGSDESHKYVGAICKNYIKSDERILYKHLEENEGIVGNTNKSIQMATGTYLGLLDHDDILHESALYECMRAIQDKADFIYTDEMKFKNDIENSVDIICKSGFGKDELRSHNYICHFVVFKRSLLDGMNELYRKECEGSQDYDMVLRLTEKAEKIVHIPKILYYWRVHAGSVSQDLSVKQYAVDSAIKAITGQLNRTGEKGKVSCNLPYETIYRIQYEFTEHPLVSICLWGIQGINVKEYIENLLAKTSYRPLEIVVSTGEEIDINDENIQIKNIKTKTDKNRYEWFERARKYMCGEYQLYLKGACIPENENWIEELLMYARRHDVGVVGTAIKSQWNKVAFGGAVLDWDEGVHIIDKGLDWGDQGYEANMRYVRNITALTSMCMMISRKRMEEIGGYSIELGDCADIDFCLRCQEKKYWNVWNCFSAVYYSESESVIDFWKNVNEFKIKWRDKILQRDEFYHPLLKELKKM